MSALAFHCHLPLPMAAIHVEEALRFAVLHDFAGQKPLPPGIRKNLMRGKPQPRGSPRSICLTLT